MSRIYMSANEYTNKKYIKIINKKVARTEISRIFRAHNQTIIYVKINFA
jgi:hypothetical protein